MGRYWIIAVALASLLGSAALAQDADYRQPGIWHEGKRLGYTPAHLRASKAAFVGPTRAGSRTGTPVAPPVSPEEVEPATYYEPGEVAPEYFSAEPAWDAGPVGGCAAPYCCPPPIWVRAELLGWWLGDMNLPALVTTSSPGTPPDMAGVLGQPGTQVLFGDGDLDRSPQLGGRFTLGRWLDPCECAGFEASYFFLGQGGTNYSVDGFDQSILARPVTSLGVPAAMLVAYPGLLNGSIDIGTSSEMQGFEALLRVRWCGNQCSNMSFVAGYRYLNLDESLQINQSSRFTVAQGSIVAGTELRLFDQFATENQFHGAQIGFAYTVNRCYWTFEGQMKFAVGNSHSEVTIDGGTQTTVPGGGSANFVGGLLAQQTNIGRYTSDELAFVPELTLTMRYELGCNLQLLLGYNLIYWTNAARPGDQIDTNVSQFPPEPSAGGRPRFEFNRHGVVVQGLQAGLEWSF